MENFGLMRFDDGYYGQVWDAQSNSKEKFINDYKLTEEEFSILQFKHYWCEDLLETIDEENFDSENNFKKVSTEKVTEIKKLKQLLEKIFRIEKSRVEKK